MSKMGRCILRESVYTVLASAAILLILYTYDYDTLVGKLFFWKLYFPFLLLLFVSLLNSLSYFIAIFTNRDKASYSRAYFKSKRPKALKITVYVLLVIALICVSLSSFTLLGDIEEKTDESNMLTEFVYTDEENRQTVLKTDTSSYALTERFWFYGAYGVNGRIDIEAENEKAPMGGDIYAEFEYLNGLPSFFAKRCVSYFERKLTEDFYFDAAVQSKADGDIHIEYTVLRNREVQMLFYTDNAVWYGKITERNGEELDTEYALDMFTDYFRANIEYGLNYNPLYFLDKSEDKTE